MAASARVTGRESAPCTRAGRETHLRQVPSSLVGWRIRNEIAILDVGGQLLVNPPDHRPAAEKNVCPPVSDAIRLNSRSPFRDMPATPPIPTT